MSKSRNPVLPWKIRGSYPTVGWDIETEWGMDANGDFWVNQAHGGDPYLPTNADNIISDMNDEWTANEFRDRVGIKRTRPQWMTTALANGWTPPENWKDPEGH